MVEELTTAVMVANNANNVNALQTQDLDQSIPTFVSETEKLMMTDSVTITQLNRGTKFIFDVSLIDSGDAVL